MELDLHCNGRPAANPSPFDKAGQKPGTATLPSAVSGFFLSVSRLDAVVMARGLVLVTTFGP